jgi:AmmeMemoRadiSam system protein A
MHCLSDTDRNSILELARQAITEAVCQRRLFQQLPQSEIFNQYCGVFVTVHVKHKLRGCIGVIEAKDRLAEAISRCAFSAALEDPRFNPMRPEELPDVDVEVSLLSALQPVRPEEIEIGKHGLLIEQGIHRGLLLPQVAVEHNLDREKFLQETCYKARLPIDAWKSPRTRIYAFTCEIVQQEKSPRLNQDAGSD